MKISELPSDFTKATLVNLKISDLPSDFTKAGFLSRLSMLRGGNAPVVKTISHYSIVVHLFQRYSAPITFESYQMLRGTATNVPAYLMDVRHPGFKRLNER